MEVIRYGETCTVKQANSNTTVDATVFEFNAKKNLIVVINKSVKLPMIWNGRLYEGRMAGIDFTSTGPSIHRSTTGR